MKRINLFATKNDLLLVLDAIEARRPLTYTRAGMIPTETAETWTRAADLPRLGFAAGDQASACDSFLVLEQDSAIYIEQMKMFNGMPRYDVYQSNNPDSIDLRTGGRWTDGTIISSEITTLSLSPVSQALMKYAHSAIKKHFTRVRAFWVGPEALVALRSGARLTIAIQSPPEYNLREETSQGHPPR